MKTVALVTGALCACALGLGLWLGSRPPLDESAMITRYATHYVASEGGTPEDCHAVPGRRTGVWLVILCEGAKGRFAYPVDHNGRLVQGLAEEA